MSYPPNRNRINFETSWENVGASQSGPADRSAEADRQSPKRVPAPRSPSGAGPGENDSPRRVSPQSQHSSPVGHATDGGQNANTTRSGCCDTNDEGATRTAPVHQENQPQQSHPGENESANRGLGDENDANENMHREQQQRRPPPPPPPQRRHPTVETDRPLGTQQRPLMPGPKPRSQPHQQSHALNPLYPPGTPPSRHRDRTHDDDKGDHRLHDNKDDFSDTHGRGDGGGDERGGVDVTPPSQTTAGGSGGTPRGDGSSATPRGRPPVPPSPRQPPSLVDTPRSHSVPEQPRSRPQSRADSRRDSRRGSDSNSNAGAGGDGLPRVPEHEGDDDRGHSSGRQPGRQDQQGQQQQQRGALVGSSSSRGVSPKVPSRRPPSTSRGGSNPPPRTPRLRPSITSESPIRPPLPTHTAPNDSSHGDEHAPNSHGEDRGDDGGDGRGVSPHGSNVGQEDSGAAPQPSWTDVYGGIPGRRASEFEKVNPLERKDTPEPDTRHDGAGGQNRRQHDDDEDEEATLGMLGEPLREDDDNDDFNDDGHGRDNTAKDDANANATTDENNEAVAANDDRSASTDHANAPSQFTFPTDEPAAANDDRDANVNDNDNDHDNGNARRPQSENGDYGNGSSTSGRRDDGADNDVVAEPHSSTPAAAAINPQTMDGSQQDHDADARSENSKNADDRAAPYNGDDRRDETNDDHPRGQQQEQQRTSADEFNRQESAPTPPAVLDDASSTRRSPTRPYEHNGADDDDCVSPESPKQGRHTSGPTDSSDTDARRPDDRHDRPDADNDRRGAADSYGNDTTADRRGGDVDRGGYQNEAAPLPRTVSNQSAHSRTSRTSRTSRAVSDRGSRRADGQRNTPANTHAAAPAAATPTGHDQPADGDDRGVSPMANYLPPGAMGRGVPPAATADSRRGSQASGRGNTRTTTDRDQRAGSDANDRNRRDGGSRGASASVSALASRSSSTVTASVIVDVESASNVSAAAAVTPTRIAPIGDLGRSISAAISDSGGRNQRSSSGRQDVGRQELPRSSSSNDNRAATASASAHDVSPLPRNTESRNESRSMSKQSMDMYGSSSAAAATMARRVTASDKKDGATTVAVEFVLSGLVLGDLWETSKRQQQDVRAAVKTEIWHLIADHGVAVDQISTDFSDSRIARDGIGIVGADVTPEKSLAEARSAERDRSAHINSQSSPSGSHKASTFEGYRSRPDLYPTDEHGSISPSKFQTAGDSSSVRRTMHGDVSPSKTHHLQSGDGEGDDGRGVDLHEDPANAPKFSGVITGISSRTKRAVIKDTLSCYLGSARAFTGTIACVASVTGILEQAIDIKPKTRRIDGLLIPDRSTGSVSFPEPDSMQAYERRRRMMQGLPDVPGISAPATTSQQVSGAKASASACAHQPISSTSSMPHASRQYFNDSSYRTVQSVRDGDPQSHHSSHHDVGGATHFVDGRTNQPSALHLSRNGSHVDPHRSQTTPMESHPRNSNRNDRSDFVDADHDNDRIAAGDVSRAVLEEGAPYHGTTRLAGLSRENEDIVLRGMNQHHQGSSRADPSATAGDSRGAGRAHEQQVLTGLSAHRLARPGAGNPTAPAERNRHPDDCVDRGGLDRGASVTTSTAREGLSEGISKRDFYDAAMPITEREKSSKRPGAPPPRATVQDLVPPMPNPTTTPISVSKPVELTREEFLYGDHGAEKNENNETTTSSTAAANGRQERTQRAMDQGAPPLPVEYSSLHPAHPENARSPVIPAPHSSTSTASAGRYVADGRYREVNARDEEPAVFVEDEVVDAERPNRTATRSGGDRRGFGVEDLQAARDPLSNIGSRAAVPTDSRKYGGNTERAQVQTQNSPTPGASNMNSRSVSGVSGARAAVVPASVPRSLVESFSGPFSGAGDAKSGSRVSGNQRPAATASSRGVSQTVGGAPPPQERATSHVVGSRSTSHVSGQNNQQYQHPPPQQSNRGGESVNMQPQTPSRRLSGAMSSAAASTAPSDDGDRTTTAGNSRSTSRQQQQHQTQQQMLDSARQLAKHQQSRRLKTPEVPIEDRLGSSAAIGAVQASSNNHHEESVRRYGGRGAFKTPTEEDSMRGGGDGSRRMSDREGLVRSPERQPENQRGQQSGLEEGSFYVYRTKDVPLQQHAQRKATQHYQW